MKDGIGERPSSDGGIRREFVDDPFTVRRLAVGVDKVLVGVPGSSCVVSISSVAGSFTLPAGIYVILNRGKL